MVDMGNDAEISNIFHVKTKLIHDFIVG
jgi:hypothetical protein